MEKVKPKIGDHVQPDQWPIGQNLLPGDEATETWPGCQFRLPSKDGDLAVNIKVTGRKHFLVGYFSEHGMLYRQRIKIEFVGDGEPSTFTGGWHYFRY